MVQTKALHRLGSVVRGVNPSVLLFISAIIAIIFANSPLRDIYFSFLDSPVNVTIGSYNLFSHHGHAMSLQDFVNDALMAIFFFVIGLEIKKEIMIGELSSMRKALLPIIAAIGGMVVPVLFFLLVSHESPAMRGAAIPMATDIAFALAVLSLLGKRVPIALKIFLTALAVVDDIGGILVIAIFYTSHIAWTPLLLGLGLLVLCYFLGRKGLDKAYIYYLIGFFVWTLFLSSGVHTTISGVLLALTIPAKATVKLPDLMASMKYMVSKFEPTYEGDTTNSDFISHGKLIALRKMEKRVERTISPVQFMEHDLHPIVNYFILPLFAFVNSGVTFGGITLGELAGVPLAVFLGLFFGKMIGVFGFTYIFLRLGVVRLPAGVTRNNLFGVSIFGGIGFTVSLFIANLSYGPLGEIGAALLNQAKIGVFVGTFVSGVFGYFYLSKVLKKEERIRSTHLKY
ncbi:Na+/H+ antiporter NhaA [Porphyromonas sp.]|uniref:Na+/H+ antiporter NhaA n=1 Tax=Porphyromonas sp. TaxID=1924944 RepID=UPI0026DDB9F9|nr:Na+/H+ antiporter NhaA [Porphyromonas sp.]MDO4695648.1 Na+/H+ antiporter NhaA [Porphyromonas sp.]MDO4771623.1 Na+/H+ antiporter NhaA [Porphyromonas sp.]